MFKVNIQNIVNNCIRPRLKDTSSPNTRDVINSYLKKNPKAAEIEPFCQTFWKSINLKSYRRYCGNVTYHGHLNGINHHLTTHTNPNGLTEVFFGTGVTPKEMIELTDAEFKALQKTTKTIQAFRCINEKPDFFTEHQRYLKSLNVKKGDIVTMPEYAYATSDINWAKSYLRGSKGITYDITIPEGSRISEIGYGINNEITFPRSSQFECLGTEQQGDVLLVKLKYIQPIDYLS